MVVPAQQACYCSLVEWVACGGGYFAVGRDFSFGDGADDAAECGVTWLVFADSIFQDSSLEVLWDRRAAHEVNFIRV